MSVQAMSWVFDHSEAAGNDRCVLLSIANHCDAAGTDAYPGQATIAHEARCSVETVRRATKRLEALGELAVEEHAGLGRRRKTHRYSLPRMRETLNLTGIPEGARTGQQDPENRSREPSEPVTHPPENRSPVTAEPSVLDPSKVDPSVVDPSARASNRSFDEFWSECPRRVGKGAARRAWQKRIRDGTDPQELVDGMSRYAEWVRLRRVETRYICHPSTWLNQERETDELDFNPDPEELSPGEETIMNLVRYRQRKGDHDGRENGGGVRGGPVRGVPDDAQRAGERSLPPGDRGDGGGGGRGGRLRSDPGQPVPPEDRRDSGALP